VGGPTWAEDPWEWWPEAQVFVSLVDFDFAKEQLLLMLRSLYSHPNGQMPACEWNFSDVTPRPAPAWLRPPVVWRVPQKRAGGVLLPWAEWLCKEVLAPVSHRHVVPTIPRPAAASA
jgi:hypothetical protein